MSLYSIRSGVDNHPEDTFLQSLTDLVSFGGVASLEDNDYLVEEPGGGGLNVDVNPGNGYVKGIGNAYPIRNTATETVSINANASGNPRITSIVAYVDLSITPGNMDEGDDIHLLAAVDGTPAGSPTAPSDSTIQAAVGASNPWIKLADVAVASGASGISNANITDQRRRVYFRQLSPLVTVSYATPYAHDYSICNQFQMTLTGNLTLNAPTNMEIGEWLIGRLIQNGTGGYSLTFGTGLTGKSPDMTINTTASKTSTIAVNKVGASAYDVYLVGKDY